MKTILVTGGLGYIGSHTVVELINAGYTSVIVDNLSNSSIKVLDRIEQITGIRPIFYQCDIQDKQALTDILYKHQIDGVIHFAALKAVGESVQNPLEYYQNNVSGSIELFRQLKNHNIKTIVFSSSATVYGDPHKVPIKEDFPLKPTNPYGWSKLMIEQVLRDLYTSDNQFKVGILRYFNPIGAHSSGLIGEDPQGIPNNLMPYIAQVAVGRREYLSVFGNDYATHDGTGIRDYIHVVDLALGHVRTLEYLSNASRDNLLTVNLGTGRGYSVLDVVQAFEKASGKKIDYKFMPRRSGDIAACYADTNLAQQLLGWRARFGIEEMCRDTWNWQTKNSNGYTN
ncbi:MAG: galE [Burkholderiales bacterium]|jgi:UDP-glucose 4-epimerase|nr:galE [Burkholderiales bacterium]